jgi:hypothetical protein
MNALRRFVDRKHKYKNENEVAGMRLIDIQSIQPEEIGKYTIDGAIEKIRKDSDALQPRKEMKENLLKINALEGLKTLKDAIKKEAKMKSPSKSPYNSTRKSPRKSPHNSTRKSPGKSQKHNEEVDKLMSQYQDLANLQLADELREKIREADEMGKLYGRLLKLKKGGKTRKRCKKILI